MQQGKGQTRWPASSHRNPVPLPSGVSTDMAGRPVRGSVESNTLTTAGALSSNTFMTAFSLPKQQAQRLCWWTSCSIHPMHDRRSHLSDSGTAGVMVGVTSARLSCRSATGAASAS